MGKTLGKNNFIYVHETCTSHKVEQVSFVLPKSDMLEMKLMEVVGGRGNIHIF